MNFGLKLKDQWCEHYKCWVTFDHLDDADPLFKVRDHSLTIEGDIDRNFCVYFVYDGAGRIVYIGKGRFWDYREYGYDKFKESRPLIHSDFLSSQIRPDWKVGIIYMGLTDLEAKILEALYIFLAITSGRTLTKTKAEKWDGESLINKKRETVSDFYNVASVYLNDWVWKSLKTYCLKESQRLSKVKNTYRHQIM